MNDDYDNRVLIAYLQIQKEHKRYLNGDKSAYTTVLKHNDNPYTVIDAVHQFYNVDAKAKDALNDALIRLIRGLETVRDATIIFLCLDYEEKLENDNKAAFQLNTIELKKFFVKKIDSHYENFIKNDISFMGFRHRIKDFWGM